MKSALDFRNWFKFRSPVHKYWFYLTITILACCLIIAFVTKSKLFLISGSMFHVFTVIPAAIAVSINPKSVIYSKDCIWFNGFMVAVYVALYYLLPIKLGP